ncbi:unnamed protein product [Timema podura]|uniref:Uncharacterized protein n=1 Tax=Timema podura TaxID=61482 RepID=A0ABN7NKU1_TIMPD|nr:unnamed protein product [Timema podura]
MKKAHLGKEEKCGKNPMHKESNSGDYESSEENIPEDQLESEENEDYEDNTLDQQEEQAESGEDEGYEVKITKDLNKDQEDSDEGDEDYDSNEIENVPKSESDLDEIEGYQIATPKGEKEVVVEEKESTENDEPETAGVRVVSMMEQNDCLSVDLNVSAMILQITTLWPICRAAEGI